MTFKTGAGRTTQLPASLPSRPLRPGAPYQSTPITPPAAPTAPSAHILDGENTRFATGLAGWLVGVSRSVSKRYTLDFVRERMFRTVGVIIPRKNVLVFC